MNSDRIWTLMARKMAGEISLEELTELEVLLKENPHVHVKIQSVEESWNQDPYPDEQDSEQAYQRLTDRLKERGFHTLTAEDNEPTTYLTDTKPGLRRFRRLLITAVMILIAGPGAFYLLSKHNQDKEPSSAIANSTNSISTEYGNHSTRVELPDGSMVWLNSGSTLTYDKQFGVQRREVNLTGEGFFHVVHNAEKPFIIHTAYVDIKDLGTQFNVKCYPEDKVTETSLVEGSVEVTVKKGNKKYPLAEPGHKLVISNQDIKPDSIAVIPEKIKNHLHAEPVAAYIPLTYLPQDSFSIETAWTYNKLSFDDETFREVAKKMERWYNRKIEFKNKKFEEIHLTVSFTIESFEQALDALKYTNRFNYVIKDKQATIY